MFIGFVFLLNGIIIIFAVLNLCSISWLPFETTILKWFYVFRIRNSCVFQTKIPSVLIQ